MTVSQMMDYLALLLVDSEKKKWKNPEKLMALNNAQLQVANLIHPGYLDLLEVTEESVAVTAGKITVSSGLASKLLRGREGIARIIDSTTGIELIEQDVTDLKGNENSLRKPTLKEPHWYLYGGKIYILSEPAITTVDLSYLRQPKPLLYDFTCAISGGGSTTQFVAGASQGLSAVDSYYVDAVIYSWQFKKYFIVTAYTGSSRTFTVTPAASSDFGTSTFYFMTHSFDQTNLENLYCELNDSLHGVMLKAALAECLGMKTDGEEKSTAKMKAAVEEIGVLNATYKEAQGVGKLDQKAG